MRIHMTHVIVSCLGNDLLANPKKKPPDKNIEKLKSVPTEDKLDLPSAVPEDQLDLPSAVQPFADEMSEIEQGKMPEDQLDQDGMEQIAAEMVLCDQAALYEDELLAEESEMPEMVLCDRPKALWAVAAAGHDDKPEAAMENTLAGDQRLGLLVEEAADEEAPYMGDQPNALWRRRQPGGRAAGHDDLLEVGMEATTGRDQRSDLLEAAAGEPPDMMTR